MNTTILNVMPSTRPDHGGAEKRFIGIDAGAETIKLVELSREGGTSRITRREISAIEITVDCLPVDGVLSLTLSFNGDPISAAALDNFAYEVKARFDRKRLRRNSPSLVSA
ncbi:MAG TPA: hypothetical protein VK327_02040 [Candidatus Paceibacterota bacterium]|nr:hypothetical protein [Candidatus Paceibacterota bacterium]